MKKIGSLILVFLVIAALTCIAGCSSNKEVTGSVVTGGCHDTDGGIDYYLRGNITKTGVNSDVCAKRPDDIVAGSTTGDLIEFYCDGDIAKAVAYECPNGCKDGACIDPMDKVILLDQRSMDIIGSNENEIPCRDSDGGKAYSIKGSLSGTTIDPSTATDECMQMNGEAVLAERYCFDQEHGAVEYYSCYDQGKGCEDGACVALEPVTESKDLTHHYTVISDEVMTEEPGCSFGGAGNYEPWAQGYINIKAGLTPTDDMFTDFIGITAMERCDKDVWNIKWEFYCDSHGYPHMVKVKCENGCQNGICERDD